MANFPVRGGDAVTAVRTRDWNEAGAAVAGAYFPHELSALEPGERLDLAMCAVDLGAVTIGCLGWGAEVAIDCDYPEAYEVNAPLSGVLESRHGERAVVSEPGQATVFRANAPAPIVRWSGDCTVVGVKFDRARLERELERVLRAPVGAVGVPAQLDTGSEQAAGWLHLVRNLAGDLERISALLRNELLREQIAGAVTAGFALAVAPEAAAEPVARPRLVRRVLDRLHDDPGAAWSVADMADVAGVSVRRLQEGFREYVGTTPLAYLRGIRLERAHADLREAAEATTVADVAAKWGFAHTGRFAAAYRGRYGCSPSRTLRS